MRIGLLNEWSNTIFLLPRDHSEERSPTRCTLLTAPQRVLVMLSSPLDLVASAATAGTATAAAATAEGSAAEGSDAE